MAIGLLYGLTGADVILTDANADNIPEFSTATFTAWTARTGGTQITELYTFPGQAATTTVVGFTDGAGKPRRLGFYGPDTRTAGIWMRNEAATGDTRWLVLPWEDLGTRVGGVTAHSALTGLTTGDDHTQYLNNTRGDVRYYTKTIADGQEVRLTGAQTIAGIKTFSSSPVIPDSSLTIAKTTGLQAALDGKLGTASNIQAHANVSDAALADGDIYRYDGGSNLLVPVDITSQFAAVDASTGRIVTSAEPQWYVPIVVINEGDPVPANFPATGIVFSRPAAPTLVPVPAGSNSISGSTAVVVTTTQAFAVGDYIGFSIGTSGETNAPAVLPVIYTVAYSTGAAAKVAGPQGTQTGSAQNDIQYARVTTAIPPGATVTVTANQSRVQLMVSLIKMINLFATPGSVLDASLGGQGTPTLSLSIGPTSPTTVANQLALASFTANPGTGGVVRTIAGTGGWQAVGPTVNQLSTSGASARMLGTFYRILSATGTVTATATITSSDGTGSAWAGTTATFKAA